MASVRELIAQDAPAGGAAGAPATGAAEATPGAGTPATGAKPAAGGTPQVAEPEPSPGAAGDKPVNPFSFGDLPTPEQRPGSLLLPGGGSGASSTFGSGSLLQPRQADAAGTDVAGGGAAAGGLGAQAPTFTAPGRYGGTQQFINTGQGRFTRPRYRYGATFSMGFDDNINQASDEDTGIPQQEIRQVIPGQPEISTTVTERQFVGIRSFNSKFVPVFRTVTRKVVLRPAVPDEEIVQVIPGIEGRQRQSSVVSGINGTMDVQWVKGRSLFTFDLRAGADYYWSRDGDPLDYNGQMSLLYIKRMGSRTQITASANANYSTQPDYSNFNAATVDQGTYFTGETKLDLEYRWTSRFITDTSFGLNTVNYIEGPRETAGNWGATLGNEFRYRISPRISLLADLRYSILRYYETLGSNSDTVSLLLGAEWQLSRRFRGVVRLGESIRTFETSGESRSTPFGELSAIYQPSRRSQFSASARYGFENTTLPTDETITLRGSLSYSHAFSPRLNAYGSINYLRNSITSGAGTQLEAQRSSSIYDATLALTYLFSRRLTFSTRYSYTLSQDDAASNNYDRSRFFITGEYNF